MQQSGSGSGYGLSQEATSFVGAGMLDPLQQQQQKPGEAVLAEAASPISSRPPAQGNFDELGHVAGGFADEENLVGEEAERGVSGNRWPRQETLALLKIRSDMDATFRDATLKGPLWEEVSRKLADLGYSRSAKKCKEKFENVHKYYKRTKEGRAGRQDGKSYRFFTQLEALHSSSNNPIVTTASATPSPPPISPAIAVSNSMAVPSSSRIQPPQVPAPAAPTTQINIQQVGHDSSVQPVIRESILAAGISFSSSSSSSSDSEDEMVEGPSEGVRKRKRSGSGGGGSQKMMVFFEGLMRQVMEKQEMMQQRFLEAFEKREQDRMAREEAWKRQEMARMTHEHEIIAQERAMSASRDATVIAFLQKLAAQTVQIPQLVTISTAPPPQPPQLVLQPAGPPLKPQPEPSPPTPPPPPPPIVQQQEQHKTQSSTISSHDLPSSSEIVVAQQEQQEVGTSFDQVSSSRWPKSEVVALIKLRTELESSYQDSGPKGPLWEEISRGMQQLGFKRSSKRCKEKWENINKYYKKVKESNKKRPEDAKTCPYFPQLDELYQKKILGSGGVGLSSQNRPEQDIYLNPNRPKTMPSQPQVATDQTKSSNTDAKTGDEGSSSQVQTINRVPMKKPEDIVKELIEQQHAVMDHIDKQEEPTDSDNLDQDNEDNDEEDDEEDMNTAYQIQFQRQNPDSSKGGNQATSFLAMVQ